MLSHICFVYREKMNMAFLFLHVFYISGYYDSVYEYYAGVIEFHHLSKMRKYVLENERMFVYNKSRNRLFTINREKSCQSL